MSPFRIVSRRPIGAASLLVASLLAASTTMAMEVARHVPPSALGFVVVQNLARFDARVSKVLGATDLQFPGPLTLLQAITNIGPGLDRDGDLLIAALPGGATTERPRFAVWLPVDDYSQLVASLQGTPGERITAVTVAGEDLLIASHGEWAVLMDPTERAQLEQIIASTPRHDRRLIPWNTWLESNEVVAVLLPGGIRAFLTWAMNPLADGRAPTTGDTTPDDELFDTPADELFEADDDQQQEALEANQTPDRDRVATARLQIQRSLREMPKLMFWAAHTEVAAFGLRIDEGGNAIAGGRWSWRKAPGIDFSSAEADQSSPLELYQGGDFIATAEGNLPGELVVEGAGAYGKWLLRGLEKETHTKFSPQAINTFVEAMQAAAHDIESLALLTRSGEADEGVYTNSFLALRVESSGEFLEQVRIVMRAWNEVNYDIKTQMKLAFDSQSVKVDGRDAIEYSIDMASAIGTPELPEIRQAMEKLFGPEGKLRLVFCAVDDDTILMSTGTPDQAKVGLAALDQRSDRTNSFVELEPAETLLPERSTWRLYVSPHGYTDWLRQQMDAVLGPVLGGPVVKGFPESPPVGIAGDFHAREASIEVAMPIDTIKGAATYFKE